jgi:ankyrin repeat protein
MDAEDIEPLFRAAAMGDVDEVARRLDAAPYLIEARDPSIDDQTLLIVAAHRGRAGVARLLLERGADVNASDSMDSTALHLAACRDNEEVVNLLLSSGADTSMKDGDDDDDTALMCASYYGHLAVVRQLSRHMQGHGLDERDENGCTALWTACYEGHADVVRVLLLAGADHTIADNYDRTPLQFAEEIGRHECIGVIQVSTFSCTFTRSS